MIKTFLLGPCLLVVIAAALSVGARAQVAELRPSFGRFVALPACGIWRTIALQADLTAQLVGLG